MNIIYKDQNLFKVFLRDLKFLFFTANLLKSCA